MGRSIFSGEYSSLPSSAETRILFVGDMHLGRQASGLPAGLSGADLGPRQAWERVIQTALDRNVQAVALAGDLVDHDNALFEAYGLLESGIRRLTEAGIQVCAVAGNHDTEVLPRLVRHIEGLHLLGPRGTWSTLTLSPDDGPAVRLAGWSFPESHHRSSPLASAPPAPEPGLITLGLLHCDRDAPGSPYAPVSTTDLKACGYQGWFLGHVHLPGPVPEDGSPFYLGSLTGLNPKEQGLHGPVLVQVSAVGEMKLTRLPLAPLRWEELVIDAAEWNDPQGHLPAFLLGRIERRLSSLAAELEAVTQVGLRLVLTGTVHRDLALQQALASLDLEALVSSRFFVQKISDRTRPAIDLDRLAEADHPAGVLARQILLLEHPAKPVPGIQDPAAARVALIQAARHTWNTVDARNSFSPLGAPGSVGEDTLIDRLLMVARRSLTLLLARKGAPHAVD